MATESRTSLKTGADTMTEQVVRDASDRADQAIQATRRAAHGALDSLNDKVDEFGDSASGAFARAAARVDELTRHGIERARETSNEVRTQVARAGDRTVGYIQDEPVKSVLIAAAAGAAIAALIGLLARSRASHGR